MAKVTLFREYFTSDSIYALPSVYRGVLVHEFLVLVYVELYLVNLYALTLTMSMDRRQSVVASLIFILFLG